MTNASSRIACIRLALPLLVFLALLAPAAVAQAYLDSRARLGFPMAPKEWAAEVLAQIEKKAA